MRILIHSDFKKGALCLFFFIWYGQLLAQEIIWKGKELQSGQYKTIDGEITIRTPEDTIIASKAIIYQEPKKAILKGNVTMTRKGTLVTSDSATYLPSQKMVIMQGNVNIISAEGILKSEAFQYDLNQKHLTSMHPAHGTANGIQFNGERCRIFTRSQNMQLWGNARWQNDTIKGNADSIFLDKSNQILKMSKNAKIVFTKRSDEIAGRTIEIDLKTSKITRIEGSKVKRSDVRLSAKKIKQEGENYRLEESVEIQSKDSAITTFGDKAFLQKSGMQITGNTKTRLLDKEKKETWIYAPQLITKKDSGVENYQFYPKPNIRGQLNGFGDSLAVTKRGEKQVTVIYGHAHLQNDSLFIRGDTLELHQIEGGDIIKAKRNAMMIMLAKPYKVNLIYAADIEITRLENESELFAKGSVDSYLWNTEKENPGLNHTESATQKATIKEKKISRVKTAGVTKSKFSPLNKVDYSYTEPAMLKLKDIYSSDSLLPGVAPLVPFYQFFKTGNRK